MGKLKSHIRSYVYAFICLISCFYWIFIDKFGFLTGLSIFIFLIILNKVLWTIEYYVFQKKYKEYYIEVEHILNEIRKPVKIENDLVLKAKIAKIRKEAGL